MFLPTMFALMLLLVVVAVVLDFRQARKTRRFLTDGGAFEETIRPHPFDPEQLERLKEQVSSVGVLAVENQAQSRNSPADRWVHVFVIDVNGAIHDVVNTADVRHAARTAHGLAQAWEIPVDDHAGVLLAREEVLGPLMEGPPARPRLDD